MPDIPPEAFEDCFHPPSIPTEVFCLHCQRTYESYLIEWRERDGEPESPQQLPGFWCCPTPGCTGAGFGFDIHPVEPDYIDPDGRDTGEWVDCGCGSADEDCECLECMIASGAVDPDELTNEEREMVAEARRAREGDEDADCGASDMCTCGPGDELALEAQDYTIPLDDLLPLDDDESKEIHLSWELMMEIERKCGFHDWAADAESSRPAQPTSRRDDPPVTEEDIPF